MSDNTKFHIENNDCFGTMATLLDCIRQDIERIGYSREWHGLILTQKRDELMQLQNNFRIEKSISVE